MQSAKERANQLLKMKDGSYDGYRVWANCAPEKQPAEAVKNLAIANKAKPGQAPLVLAYFTALVQNNQFSEAEAVAKELIAKQKDYAPIYDLLYVQYASRKDLPAAENILKLKSSNNPTNPEFVLHLGMHYAAAGQPDLMRQTVSRLSDEKAFATGRLAAGDFYYLRLREFDHAREQYEAGLKAFPKEKAIYQNAWWS
jgi:Flp pilus assembly protein TadD